MPVDTRQRGSRGFAESTARACPPPRIPCGRHHDARSVAGAGQWRAAIHRSAVRIARRCRPLQRLVRVHADDAEARRRLAVARVARKPCRGEACGAPWPAEGRQRAARGRHSARASDRNAPPPASHDGTPAALAAISAPWRSPDRCNRARLDAFDQRGGVVDGGEFVDGTQGAGRVDRPHALGMASTSPCHRRPQRVDLAIGVRLGDVVQVDERQVTDGRPCSASAAHDPTPPMPTTTTRAARNRSAACSPYRRVTPEKRRTRSVSSVGRPLSCPPSSLTATGSSPGRPAGNILGTGAV